MLAALFLAAAQVVAPADAPQDTATALLRPPDSAAMATAYLDPRARELVRLARAHRGVIDASVFRYEAVVRQRISVGLRALRRDRLLYRREIAQKVEWRRDGPSRVEILGAREAAPVAMPGLRIPGDLRSQAEDFVPRPGDDRLFIWPDDDNMAWHPLVEHGESVYRYATGGSTVIGLPDGREIRLIELRVIPRFPDIRLIAGSFWIEEDGHAIVQAVFRPSRDFDLDRDLARIDPDEEGEADEVPEILKPIRFDVRYVTIEYGLWEMRWWLPRLIAFDAEMQAGPARFPLTLEITYTDYEVEPDRYGLPDLPPLMIGLAGDPHDEPRPFRYPLDVVIPEDTAALLESPYLPSSFYDMGESLMTEPELEELAARIGMLPAAPWAAPEPEVTWPWVPGRGLLRYNRIEGLSTGVRVDWRLRRARVDATARLGIADLHPNVVLGVEMPGFERTWRAEAYHRLVAVDPLLRPFGLANSLNALAFGRDDGIYFRTTGVGLEAVPVSLGAAYGVRLYAERQTAAAVGTAVSLPRLFDSGWRFRPNIAAEPGWQVGLAAHATLKRDLDPTGFRGSVRGEVTAETGSFSFVRPGLTVLLGAPLPGPLVGGVELAGGTTLSLQGDAPTTGELPVQALWYLGGPSTLRGFAGGQLAGRDFVRGRVEVANAFPAARIIVFSDAGWAGGFDDLRVEDLWTSVGIGVSGLEGLVRADLARTLRPVAQWRLDLYLDALF